MRRDVQLFINNQRVDLFDWEDINIVDTIQDVRDVNKLFVPYSRKFTIPASKNNNKIFKHYYNQNVLDSFDARFKISASIKINGDVYKNGRITLLGAKLKNDVAYSYDLVFYDGTVDLKTLIGDDELSDINSAYLNKFKITYNEQNVFYGFERGWNLVGDVMEYDDIPIGDIDDVNDPKDLIFPFISTNNYYFYDSNVDGVSPIEGDTLSLNLSPTANAWIYASEIKKGVRYKIKALDTTAASDTATDFVADFGASSNSIGTVFVATKDGDSGQGMRGTVYVPKGINSLDLRAGIRLPILIDAIEEYYGLTFTGDFFNESNEEFNRLYLWLQKEKGLYSANGSTEFLLSDASYVSGNTITFPLSPELATEEVFSLYVTVRATSPSTTYNIRVVDNNSSNILLEKTVGASGNTFEIRIKEELMSSPVDPKIYLSEISSSGNIFVEYQIIQYSKSLFSQLLPYKNGKYISATNSIDIDFSVINNMPKIKVIDFIMGLFNMFNLTAYTDLDGNIVVESLDEYYEAGNEVDITKYIDSSEREVSRNKLYSEITYEFEKPSTFAVLNSNEISGDEFGNEKIDNVYNDDTLRNLLAFDGGTYSVKPKFEKIAYERMTDQSDSETVTDFGWGWIVDKDQKAQLIKPLLFYAELNVLTSATPSSTLFWITDEYVSVDRYYRPSNSISKPPLLRQSLNFGSEFDEYYYDIGPNEVSLFTRYWKNYILSIYDRYSRIVSLKANLPISLVNSIKLNDTLRIRQNKYRINKLDVNITTGDTKLELVTWKKIIPFYDSDYRADIDTITVDSDLITVDTR